MGELGTSWVGMGGGWVEIFNVLSKGVEMTKLLCGGEVGSDAFAFLGRDNVFIVRAIDPFVWF